MLTYDIESKQWCNEAAPEMSIDEAKNFMIGLFDTHGSKMRDKITYPTSPSEMSSWPIKINEAAKFMSSLNPGDAPILSIEASTRGVPLEALAARVLSNSQQLSTLEAIIAGLVGKHKDTVNAMTNVEEIFNYDWSIGWPFIL